ncbi:MAG: glycosyltransferase family 4 protein [Desulfuromonadales bacterium]|nr:glycosyltransferase family 4 protein [Desulfuromonadales bacterium]
MPKIAIIGSLAESLIGFRGPLIREMVVLEHEVIACAPQASEMVRNELLRLGAQYVDLPLQRTGTNPLADLNALWHLIRFFQTWKPDIIFSYTIKPVIYGSIAAAIAKVPFISSMITGLGYLAAEEGEKEQRWLKSLIRQLYACGLRRNQVIFFQNNDDRDFLEKMGLLRENRSATVVVNGSGVDLEYYGERPLPQEISFLMIARLVLDKGIKEYLEAATVIKKRYPHVRFGIVGFADANPRSIREEDLQVYIEAGIIEFYGRQADVRPYIENASVYVLPSYREGTPRTVLEAMSMGRPVITTDAPGCRETVREGFNGYLVPVRDTRRLAEAMESFITNPAKITALGRNGRQLAMDKYDVRKINRVILYNLGLVRNVG